MGREVECVCVLFSQSLERLTAGTAGSDRLFALETAWPDNGPGNGSPSKIVISLGRGKKNVVRGGGLLTIALRKKSSQPCNRVSRLGGHGTALGDLWRCHVPPVSQKSASSMSRSRPAQIRSCTIRSQSSASRVMWAACCASSRTSRISRAVGDSPMPYWSDRTA